MSNENGQRPAYGAPVNWKHVVDTLYQAVDSLQTQVNQMKDLFPDDDGSIQATLDEADNAVDLYLANAGLPSPAQGVAGLVVNPLFADGALGALAAGESSAPSGRLVDEAARYGDA